MSILQTLNLVDDVVDQIHSSIFPSGPGLTKHFTSFSDDDSAGIIHPIDSNAKKEAQKAIDATKLVDIQDPDDETVNELEEVRDGAITGLDDEDEFGEDVDDAAPVVAAPSEAKAVAPKAKPVEEKPVYLPVAQETIVDVTNAQNQALGVPRAAIIPHDSLATEARHTALSYLPKDAPCVIYLAARNGIGGGVGGVSKDKIKFLSDLPERFNDFPANLKKLDHCNLQAPVMAKDGETQLQSCYDLTGNASMDNMADKGKLTKADQRMQNKLQYHEESFDTVKSELKAYFPSAAVLPISPYMKDKFFDETLQKRMKEDPDADRDSVYAERFQWQDQLSDYIVSKIQKEKCLVIAASDLHHYNPKKFPYNSDAIMHTINYHQIQTDGTGSGGLFDQSTHVTNAEDNNIFGEVDKVSYYENPDKYKEVHTKLSNALAHIKHRKILAEEGLLLQLNRKQIDSAKVMSEIDEQNAEELELEKELKALQTKMGLQDDEEEPELANSEDDIHSGHLENIKKFGNTLGIDQDEMDKVRKLSQGDEDDEAASDETGNPPSTANGHGASNNSSPLMTGEHAVGMMAKVVEKLGYGGKTVDYYDSHSMNDKGKYRTAVIHDLSGDYVSSEDEFQRRSKTDIIEGEHDKLDRYRFHKRIRVAGDSNESENFPSSVNSYAATVFGDGIDPDRTIVPNDIMMALGMTKSHLEKHLHSNTDPDNTNQFYIRNGYIKNAASDAVNKDGINPKDLRGRLLSDSMISHLNHPENVVPTLPVWSPFYKRTAGVFVGTHMYANDLYKGELEYAKNAQDAAKQVGGANPLGNGLTKTSLYLDPMNYSDENCSIGKLEPESLPSNGNPISVGEHQNEDVLTDDTHDKLHAIRSLRKAKSFLGDTGAHQRINDIYKNTTASHLKEAAEGVGIGCGIGTKSHLRFSSEEEEQWGKYKEYKEPEVEKTSFIAERDAAEAARSDPNSREYNREAFHNGNYLYSVDFLQPRRHWIKLHGLKVDSDRDSIPYIKTGHDFWKYKHHVGKSDLGEMKLDGRVGMVLHLPAWTKHRSVTPSDFLSGPEDTKRAKKITQNNREDVVDYKEDEDEDGGGAGRDENGKGEDDEGVDETSHSAAGEPTKKKRHPKEKETEITSVFLPSVSKSFQYIEEYLSSLAQKAGAKSAHAWQLPDAWAELFTSKKYVWDPRQSRLHYYHYSTDHQATADQAKSAAGDAANASRKASSATPEDLDSVYGLNYHPKLGHNPYLGHDLNGPGSDLNTISFGDREQMRKTILEGKFLQNKIDMDKHQDYMDQLEREERQPHSILQDVDANADDLGEAQVIEKNGEPVQQDAIADDGAPQDQQIRTPDADAELPSQEDHVAADDASQDGVTESAPESAQDESVQVDADTGKMEYDVPAAVDEVEEKAENFRNFSTQGIASKLKEKVFGAAEPTPEREIDGLAFKEKSAAVA